MAGETEDAPGRNGAPDGAEEEETKPAPPEESGAATAQGATDLKEAELAGLQTELAETKDRMLRIAAEFDNYRKRMQREIVESGKYASEPLLRELLQVADNLARALASAGTADNGSPGVKSLLDGVLLTQRQFLAVLNRFGVTEIEAKGSAFDPNRHEALGFVETADVQEDVVVDEMQPGYMLHDRVLRPAAVRLARAPAPPAQPPDAEPPSPSPDVAPA